ncbi:MAG TPA: diacylglycerol kinase family protein [Candidatus Acidoferrum sp.]|nr:diacylglycerol kinase family protein [Candidatus Acidoferrum sp.]
MQDQIGCRPILGGSRCQSSFTPIQAPKKTVLRLLVRTPDAPAIVFVNPAAGRGRTRKYLPRVRKVFAERRFSACFVETSSRQELQDLACRAIADGNRLLIAMGGDGTLQALAQEAIGHEVVLGVIPAGGGNDFAAALGLAEEPVAAARLLLAGEVRTIDVARATTDDGKARIFLGGGGIGLDAETARYANEHYGSWPGRWRYVGSALHAYTHFQPLRVQVEFPENGVVVNGEELLTAGVLNTPTYGAGIRFAPEARIDDGMLDVVLLEYLRFGQILGMLPRLLINGEIEAARMKRFRTPRVRLTPDRECMFHGDGEIFGPTPVEIEVRRGSVSVLAPRAGKVSRGKP